jgi:hypothetical protein
MFAWIRSHTPGEAEQSAQIRKMDGMRGRCAAIQARLEELDKNRR